MIVESLPNYTAERYYLLSEIEQKVIYVFNAEFGPTDYFPPSMFGVVYCLYDASIPFEKFQKDATDLITKSEKFISNFEDALLSVEVYLNGTDFNAFKPQLQTMLNWLNATFQFGCVVLGVSDSVAGTAALNKCHDFIEFLYDREAEKMHSAVSFVASDRKQLLGHDPKREPDAKGGIFQALCYDFSQQKYNMKDWYQNCKDHMVVSGHINEEIDAAEGKPATKKNKANNDPELVWMLFFAIVALLIGVSVKVFMSESHYHQQTIKQ